jgi:hypothetical protein
VYRTPARARVSARVPADPEHVLESTPMR